MYLCLTVFLLLLDSNMQSDAWGNLGISVMLWCTRARIYRLLWSIFILQHVTALTTALNLTLNVLAITATILFQKKLLPCSHLWRHFWPAIMSRNHVEDPKKKKTTQMLIKTKRNKWCVNVGGPALNQPQSASWVTFGWASLCARPLLNTSTISKRH